MFGFRAADAAPREMSAGAFRVRYDPFSFVPSDTFGSFMSVVVGFRATEVFGLIDLTLPIFIVADTRHWTFRAVALHRSQAEKAVTVPIGAGDGLGDLGKAAKGPTVPGEPVVEHNHPFQFAFPFADEQRSRIEAGPVPRLWLALLEGTAVGRIDRVALRSANRTHSRLVEVA